MFITANLQNNSHKLIGGKLDFW